MSDAPVDQPVTGEAPQDAAAGDPLGREPLGGDPVTVAADPAQPAPGARRPKARTPGLIDQLGATKAAVIALVRAHVNLAKAEATEIGDEVKIVAAAVGIAVASLILLVFLVAIGIILFLGEWLFGSIGWGVLLGSEALVLLAAGGVLAVLHAGRVARSIGLGFIAGLIVAILFGTNAPNLLYSAIADQLRAVADPGPSALLLGAVIGAVVVGLLGAFAGARNGSAGDAGRGLIGGAIIGALVGLAAGGLVRLAADEGSRPLVVGVILIGAIVGLVGFTLGARSGGASGAVSGLIGGILLGAALGAFSAITFTWHVAIAIGLAVFLGLAIAFMLAEVATKGIDTEDLKRRFYPQSTIDMTKETIEWAKARIPGAPRS